MLHLHDLYHVEVGLSRGLVDCQHGIHDIRSQLGCEAGVELGGEGRLGDGEEEFAVDLAGQLELVKELR
jgi:hypothetical protein